MANRRRGSSVDDERRADVNVHTPDYDGPDRRERAAGSVGRRASDRHRGGSLIDRLWLLGVTMLVAYTVAGLRSDEHKATQQQLATTERIERISQRTQRLAVQTAKNQRANTLSLCSFREDLAHRVADTTRFLQHPNELPGFATPAVISAVKVSLAGQRATLASLSPPRSPLMCAATGPKPIPPAPPPNLPPNVARALR